MEPGEGSVVDAVPGGESFKKNGVVDGIKCCRKIEETEAGDFVCKQRWRLTFKIQPVFNHF